MATQLGTCYLLCIQPPYHHARHYAGWTADADPTRRFGEHLAGRFEPDADGALRYVGTGSPLVAAALAAGRRVDLVLAVPAIAAWSANGTTPTARASARAARASARRGRARSDYRSEPGARRRAVPATPLWRPAHAA
jgi:hypothetical protein